MGRADHTLHPGRPGRHVQRASTPRAVGLPGRICSAPRRRSTWHRGGRLRRGRPPTVRDLVWSGDDPAAIRARMEDLGLRGGERSPAPIDWRGDEASFLRDLDRLGPVLEAASVLGLRTTGTWVMPELPGFDADRAQVAALHVRRLGKLARRLDSHGIRLGLEVIGVETFRAPASAGSSFVTRSGRPRPRTGRDLGRGSESGDRARRLPPARGRRADRGGPGMGGRAGLLGPRRRLACRARPVEPSENRRDADSRVCRATMGRSTSGRSWPGWRARGTMAP